MKRKKITDEVYNEWLGGELLKDKIRALETGKLLRCVVCDRAFFDAETDEDRSRFSCKPKCWHDCVEDGRLFAILKRGFRGPCWLVLYSKAEGLEKAIESFFRYKNTARRMDLGPNGGVL